MPGKSHGQRTLAGYSPQGRTESGTTWRLNNTKSHVIRKLHNWTLLPWLLLLHDYNFNLMTAAFMEGIYNKQQSRKVSVSHVKLPSIALFMT